MFSHWDVMHIESFMLCVYDEVGLSTTVLVALLSTVFVQEKELSDEQADRSVAAKRKTTILFISLAFWFNTARY